MKATIEIILGYHVSSYYWQLWLGPLPFLQMYQLAQSSKEKRVQSVRATTLVLCRSL